VPLFRRTIDFFRRQRGQRLPRTDASSSKKILKTLTREQVIPVDGTVPGIRYRHPCFSRNEHDGVRACNGSFIGDSYSSASIFQDHYLFGVVVLVERNHRAGIQSLRSHVKVFGVSVLLVDLDDEFRNGPRTSRSSGAAQPVLPILLLENQRRRSRWTARLRSIVKQHRGGKDLWTCPNT
jgi:hypothetical protein